MPFSTSPRRCRQAAGLHCSASVGQALVARRRPRVLVAVAVSLLKLEQVGVSAMAAAGRTGCQALLPFCGHQFLVGRGGCGWACGQRLVPSVGACRGCLWRSGACGAQLLAGLGACMCAPSAWRRPSARAQVRARTSRCSVWLCQWRGPSALRRQHGVGVPLVRGSTALRRWPWPLSWVCALRMASLIWTSLWSALVGDLVGHDALARQRMAAWRSVAG